MSDIVSVPDTFTASGALTIAEGWQCKGGQVLLSTDATGPESRGIRLSDGQGWTFPAGVNVHYRRLDGTPVIAREPIA